MIYEILKRALSLMLAFGLLILTGCNSEEVFNATVMGPSSPTVKLERIDISASPQKTHGVSQLTLAATDTQKFEAVGYFSNGSSRVLTDLIASHWQTSDTEVGFFDSPGVLIGGQAGIVTVGVIVDGVSSNTLEVTVTSAELTNITVTPVAISVAKGQTEQLTVTGYYDDGTSSDVTDTVTWTPVDTAITTVTPEGLLSGVEVGNTTLTATKDGITSNTVTVDVIAAVITDITVTPATVSIARRHLEQLTAIATYSDNSSSDVTDSVTWTPVDTAIATVTPDGLLTGGDAGSTMLTATKDEITSGTVSVDICDLAGDCLGIIDTSNGKLYASPSSVTYVDNVGGIATDDVNESIGGLFGTSGYFYEYSWANANGLCDAYNTVNLEGRTNWRLAEIDELNGELFGVYGDMLLAFGWPAYSGFWSATPDGSGYFGMSLRSGSINVGAPETVYIYASCVSNP